MRRPQLPSGGMATVLIALAANLVVGVVKAVAGLLTGSAALLAEAAHSVGDSTTELLLVTALRRSDRPADRRHPFGYGKERYFWSLLAALAILILGAGFSAYQGIHALTSPATGTHEGWIGYVVIVVAMGIEGTSLRQAVRQVRAEARGSGLRLRDYLRDPEDPAVKSVLLEDSAAMVGLLLALAGLGLREATGQSLWDGLAALLIGALLAVVAVELARTNVGLLIGKQANPLVVRGIRELVTARDEVIEVVDLLTMMVGTARILLCVRLDFIDDMSASDVERACVDLHRQLGAEFEDLDEVFIEPVPRGEPELRQRVVDRYGENLTE